MASESNNTVTSGGEALPPRKMTTADYGYGCFPTVETLVQNNDVAYWTFSETKNAKGGWMLKVSNFEVDVNAPRDHPTKVAKGFPPSVRMGNIEEGKKVIFPFDQGPYLKQDDGPDRTVPEALEISNYRISTEIGEDSHADLSDHVGMEAFGKALDDLFWSAGGAMLDTWLDYVGKVLEATGGSTAGHYVTERNKNPGAEPPNWVFLSVASKDTEFWKVIQDEEDHWENEVFDAVAWRKRLRKQMRICYKSAIRKSNKDDGHTTMRLKLKVLSASEEDEMEAVEEGNAQPRDPPLKYSKIFEIQNYEEYKADPENVDMILCPIWWHEIKRLSTGVPTFYPIGINLVGSNWTWMLTIKDILVVPRAHRDVAELVPGVKTTVVSRKRRRDFDGGADDEPASKRARTDGDGSAFVAGQDASSVYNPDHDDDGHFDDNAW